MDQLGEIVTLSPSAIRWRMEAHMEAIFEVVCRRRSAHLGRVGVMALILLGLVMAPPSRSQTQAPARTAESQAAAFVKGVVLDEKGRPVEGATVRLFRIFDPPAVKLSGAGGAFAFERKDLPWRGDLFLIAESADGRLGILNDFSLSAAKLGELLRVTLKPARTVTVSVKDAKGRAVPGARVEAIVYYRGLPEAQTGADGKAELRLPADAKLDVIVALKSGAGFDYFENYTSIQTSERPDPPPEVALVLDGARTATIAAVDTAGRPVAGAGFGVWLVKKRGKVADANIGGGNTATVRTDARGMAVFDWLPEVTEEGTPILARSREYSCPTELVVQPGQRDVTLSARLLENVRVGGRVFLPDGKPAADIDLQAEGQGKTQSYCRATATTGADGAWSALVEPDHSYIIAVKDEEWAAPAHDGIVVREHQPRGDLDFRLIKGTLIHGALTVGEDRRPDAGGQVTIIQLGRDLPEEFKEHAGEQRGMLVRWAAADAKGQYAMRVGPGEYEANGGDWKNQVTIRVANEAEIVQDFHADLPPGVALRGTITFQGKPVAGADVRSMGDTTHFEARSDNKGNFAARGASERRTIYAAAPDGALSGMTIAQAQDTDVEVELAPAASIRGRVTDGEGKPVCDLGFQAQITARNNQGSVGVFLLTRTDKEGRYEFKGLPVGAWCSVSPQLPEDKKLRKWPDQIRIEEAGVIETPDLVVVSSPRVAGRVFESGPPEKPAPWVEVRCMQVAEGEGGFYVWTRARADAQGMFQLFGESGHVILYGRTADGALAGFSEVFPEQDHEKTSLPLAPAGKLSGQLEDVDGEPSKASGRACVVRDGTSKCYFTYVQSDALGHFTLDGLPPGFDYELSFDHDTKPRRRTITVRVDKAEERYLGIVSWDE